MAKHLDRGMRSLFARTSALRIGFAHQSDQILDLDVGSLALMANYSVGHFITTFRSVFAETPYSL